jgi:hypothetical protein
MRRSPRETRLDVAPAKGPRAPRGNTILTELRGAENVRGSNFSLGGGYAFGTIAVVVIFKSNLIESRLCMLFTADTYSDVHDEGRI